jgi:hypothetical protein
LEERTEGPPVRAAFLALFAVERDFDHSVPIDPSGDPARLVIADYLQVEQLITDIADASGVVGVFLVAIPARAGGRSFGNRDDVHVKSKGVIARNSVFVENLAHGFMEDGGRVRVQRSVKTPVGASGSEVHVGESDGLPIWSRI